MSIISNIVLRNSTQSLLLTVPGRQLLKGSLQLASSSYKQFCDWSAKDHEESYLHMQSVAQAWKSSKCTDQYLIYGKVDSKSFFKWEMVPYRKCHTFLGRIIQQIKVLWRTVFGGIKISTKEINNQISKIKDILNKYPVTIPLDVTNKSNDSFCKNEVIDRQWVIKGKKVNVLFNYAPIGFGGEKLHFLIVPKEHRNSFTDVTQEEYLECQEFSTKLVNHFSKTRQNVKNVYLLNKTGKDAGQTVKHWHLHLIFSTNATQDFWGKITVIKNILFGSSPMKKAALAAKVSALRNELASI